MASSETVMVIEKPYLTVKLRARILEVDFADGLKRELERALEANTAIRESLGFLFQYAIPLDVALKDVESAKLTDNGHVKVVIPFRKDLEIPLGLEDSKRLLEKLDRLIPLEKERVAKESLESEARKRDVEAQRARPQDTSRRTLARSVTPA